MSEQKRSVRIDVSQERQPLTDNPFAGLGPAPCADGSEPESPVPEREAALYRVERTRKGGLPIFLEKRPNGKNVTVIRNICGDVEELLARLKKLCGAGGTMREGAVEIQGDHRERIEAFLRQHAGK